MQRKSIKRQPKSQKATIKRTLTAASTPPGFSHTAVTPILQQNSLSGLRFMAGPAGSRRATTIGQGSARPHIWSCSKHRRGSPSSSPRRSTLNTKNISEGWEFSCPNCLEGLLATSVKSGAPRQLEHSDGEHRVVRGIFGALVALGFSF